MIRLIGGFSSRTHPTRVPICTLAASVVLMMSACAETSTGPAPNDVRTVDGGLSNEMVDWEERLDPKYINVHVYGSFRIGTTVAGEIIRSGAANFPGHPAAGPGTCSDGRWINPSGKATAGSLEKPHPHCIASASTMEVVLEPISACHDPDGSVICRTAAVLSKETVFSRLIFGTSLTAGDKPVEVDIGLFGFTKNVVVIGEPAAGTSVAKGSPTVLLGYAIDASTLGAGAKSRRVGTLTIDLAQFTSETENLLAKSACTLDETLAFPCINRVVTATYQPLPAPDGVGEPDTVVEGFLWFSGAKEPYNYF